MFDDDEYSASVVLPLICAVSFGLAVVSYFYIEEKTEFLIGSPSSTYCLVYLIIPFFVAIGVIAGWYRVN
ncbi:MAG TPA: hypothetical protein PLP05_00355 [Sedimentisphaerales bacterium]|nr:hypothetical protein [Sedimentisphaerales bacterium]